MCTFKEAMKFLLGRIRGTEYGVIIQNGQKTIVETDKLRKFNVLLTENFGLDGKLSVPQVNRVLEKAQTIARKSQPVQIKNGSGTYKYYNYPYREGALIFDQNSKLVFGITPRVQLPSLRTCLAHI